MFLIIGMSAFIFSFGFQGYLFNSKIMSTRKQILRNKVCHYMPALNVV